jgi:hypothetical protein
MTLTRAQVGGSGVTPPAGTENDLAFPVVFPSELMLEMPCLADERARG